MLVLYTLGEANLANILVQAYSLSPPPPPSSFLEPSYGVEGGAAGKVGKKRKERKEKKPGVGRQGFRYFQSALVSTESSNFFRCRRGF